MTFFIHALQNYPEIAIFLALAIGFWFGKLTLGSFSLGVVTSSLFAGLLIGQLHITIDPIVGSIFFTMFLFAVGYEVGPPLIHGLKTIGLPQILFTVCVCISAVATTYAVSLVLGYDKGLSSGLLAGATTNSGTLGVATATLRQLAGEPGKSTTLIGLATLAYAVSYPFGTAGSAWFLARLAPKIMGIDLVRACADYDAKHGGAKPEAGVFSAYRPIAVRAYAIKRGTFDDCTAGDLEARFNDPQIFVTRARKGAEVIDCDAQTSLAGVTEIAVAAPPQTLLTLQGRFGTEIDDADLLDYSAEIVEVVMTNKSLIGKTIVQLRTQELLPAGHGVFLRHLMRSGEALPLLDDLTIERGDVLTIRGAKRDVARIAERLGYPDRPTDQTDILFMCLGIVLGGLLGAISIPVGGVTLSASPSVGALLGGLACGYLRSVHRSFGRIPSPALWVFNNLGLNGFVAVVGISAGPGLVAGLATHGAGLVLAGIVVSLVPLIVALALGRYVFKFHPAILFGASAGARSSTASIGMLMEVAGSKTPLLGYAIPYATSRILLALCGVVIVLVVH
ncbi:TrkA C-terminal domain-containing protein [Rhizobium sp. CCGE 510]|uniref:aspartate-alanine antiporter-like transporter n=1 Tax=Rhizobium sp. CCGE 510 TaxID=1132836 RepID=UPI00027B922F|nr:TrkA C-terminal domain-containing protein [Rhizobium sp. CCGE 510]EJT04469.1 transmembrane protein [Rhizobium sp. CCGE 510]